MGMERGAEVTTKLQKAIDLAKQADDDRQKALIKQVIEEVISDTMAQFGRFALRSLLTMAIGWACYIWVQLHISAGSPK